jgi:hypothetical protein
MDLSSNWFWSWKQHIRSTSIPKNRRCVDLKEKKVNQSLLREYLYTDYKRKLILVSPKFTSLKS